MGTVWKVFHYQFRDLIRGRALAGYTLFFGAATWGLLHLGGGPVRALPSLATLVILVVPLVSILVTTTFAYGSEEFTELLLSHPVGRGRLFAGLYLALTVPLAGAFLLGLGIPFLAGGGAAGGLGGMVALGVAGALLTAVFASLGFLIAVSVHDMARGAGLALLVWLALAVLYDGVVLVVAHQAAAYPLERIMLALMLLNPVDVGRVLSLMALDVSAMLGYTGAVFRDFFGGATGVVIALASLVAWAVVPAWLALHRFRHKDF
ncbi:MAG: ABC transporter permease [Gemmatimonadota bacterium]|nr:ABC transporter permease [Gemmatimonadota bacterium]MDH5758925.1 ABC transporter permease [Gemmatimonadota bacterium]